MWPGVTGQSLHAVQVQAVTSKGVKVPKLDLKQVVHTGTRQQHLEAFLAGCI